MLCKQATGASVSLGHLKTTAAAAIATADALLTLSCDHQYNIDIEQRCLVT
jgi:hypothetical protein